MHIFILLGGLLFGWRAGLAVGLFTPLASYAITGMPAAAVLPQIVIELSCYGLAAGLLREKLNLNVIWSLLGAMVAGRLALLLTVSILSLTGVIHSPLGVEVNPFAVVGSVVERGWPGLLLQLMFIPIIVMLLGKLLSHRENPGI